MRSNLSSSFSSIPSAAGGIARLACARLRDAGREVDGLLAEAGFTPADIADRTRHLDAAGQIRLLELAAIELGDDFLGLHLARNYELGEIGLLYYVLASSDLLADALRNAERFCAINNEGVRLKISLEGPVVIGIEYLDVDRSSDRQHIEFWMLTIIRICRTVTDSRLAPRRIRLRHSRPQIPADIRAYLGCEIEFDADADEISFSAAAAALPIVGADVYLNRLLLEYANEALRRERQPRRASTRASVEGEVVRLLPHGKANLSEISRRLGMSRRTLGRALSGEGTTFSEVLETLRRALARQYLRERELPISEVAWLLGYREVSSFTKAFARWNGTTPRSYRRSDRAA